jgi:hypothetical protein
VHFFYWSSTVIFFTFLVSISFLPSSLYNDKSMCLSNLYIVPLSDEWDELFSAPVSTGSSSCSTLLPPESSSSGEFNAFSFAGSAVSAGGWGM